MLDDGEPAAADRGEGRMESPGQSVTAAVTHRELYPGRPQCPGHPKSGSGQRPGVQDGIAEQFAHHERRVPDGRRKDAASTKFAAEAPTGPADAGWHAREQHHARLTHLHARPAPWARSCQRWYQPKCPAERHRKPPSAPRASAANPEAHNHPACRAPVSTKRRSLRASPPLAWPPPLTLGSTIVTEQRQSVPCGDVLHRLSLTRPPWG
jgi:hypothetical protein